MNAIVTPKGSIPGQVFLSSMDFIEHQIEIQRLKSTTNASSKIKIIFTKRITIPHLSHP